MRRILVLISIISLLVLCNSCQKRVWDNPWDGYDPSVQHNHYFKATFDNYWASGEEGKMVFISDMSGNLLAYSYINHQSIIIEPASNTLFPDRIMVTLVYESKYNATIKTVHFYTHCYVAPADWTWEAFMNDSIGYTTIHLLNIPENTRYSISDYYTWLYGDVAGSSSDTLKSEYILPLSRVPDNCYIWLNTKAGDYQYKWITGISLSESVQADLSSMETALIKTMSIPSSSFYTCRLSGYLPSGDHSTGLYPVDYGYYSGNYVNSIDLHYPSSIFTDFNLYIYYGDRAEPDKQWYQYNFGSIPDAIHKLNGTISIQDSLPNHFRVQVTGTADRLGSAWYFYPEKDKKFRYEWNVYGPASMTSFVFPALPHDLQYYMYYWFNIDSLKLSNCELKDFDVFTSYDDYIQKVFREGNYISNIVGQYTGAICYPHPVRADSRSGIKIMNCLPGSKDH